MARTKRAHACLGLSVPGRGCEKDRMHRAQLHFPRDRQGSTCPRPPGIPLFLFPQLVGVTLPRMEPPAPISPLWDVAMRPQGSKQSTDPA